MDILDRLEVQELIDDTKEMMEEDFLTEEAVKTAGWTKSSVEKFGKTIGSPVDKSGFFDACVMKMKSKVNDPDGFCASLKDKYYGTTEWRGKEKKK
jgi:hypothetical protein